MCGDCASSMKRILFLLEVLQPSVEACVLNEVGNNCSSQGNGTGGWHCAMLVSSGSKASKHEAKTFNGFGIRQMSCNEGSSAAGPHLFDHIR